MAIWFYALQHARMHMMALFKKQTFVGEKCMISLKDVCVGN